MTECPEKESSPRTAKTAVLAKLAEIIRDFVNQLWVEGNDTGPYVVALMMVSMVSQIVVTKGSDTGP